MKTGLYKDSSLTIISQIITIFAGVVIMPIVIKVAGPSMYGMFILISSAVVIILGLSSLGVNVMSRRYLPSAKNNKERRDLFYPQFYFQLFVLMAASLLFLAFQKEYEFYMAREGFFLPSYALIAYLFLYFVYSQSIDYLRYTSRIIYMNATSIFFTYAYLLCLITYVSYVGNLGLMSLFLIQTIIYFLITFPVIYLIYKELSVKFIFFKISDIGEQIRIGLPIVLNLLVDLVISTSDRFILAFFMGVTAVGYYVPAYILGSVILLIPKSFGMVVPQLMAKNIDEGDAFKSKIILFESVKFFMVLAVPFVFGIHLISREALILLTNEEVALQGQGVATIVALSSVFYGFVMFMSIVNLVELKTIVIFKSNLIAAIANIFLNLVLLYFIDSIFILAITTLVSYLIASIYLYRFLNKKWFDSRYVALLPKLIAISLTMYIIVDNLHEIFGNHSILIMLLIKVLFSIAIYSMFVIIFKIYSLEQILSIKKRVMTT